MGVERRVYPRAPADFLVAYVLIGPSAQPQEEKQGMALDISEGGMALLTNFEIPSSSDAKIRLDLKFDLSLSSGETRAIQVSGEARYCFQLFEEGKWRIGIQFMDLKDEDKKHINDFVRSFGL